MIKLKLGQINAEGEWESFDTESGPLRLKVRPVSQEVYKDLQKPLFKRLHSADPAVKAAATQDFNESLIDHAIQDCDGVEFEDSDGKILDSPTKAAKLELCSLKIIKTEVSLTEAVLTFARELAIRQSKEKEAKAKNS